MVKAEAARKEEPLEREELQERGEELAEREACSGLVAAESLVAAVAMALETLDRTPCWTKCICGRTCNSRFHSSSRPSAPRRCKVVRLVLGTRTQPVSR